MQRECVTCESKTPGMQWYSGPTCTRCWQRSNRAKTRENVNASKRLRYEKNSEKVAAQNKASTNRHIDRHRDWRRKYEIEKRVTCPQYRISKNLRSRLHGAIKSKIELKTTSSKLIGCTYAHLLIHLESKFKVGMTWENYGPYWHVDHIKPLSSFDLTKEEQVLKASHFSNLQPLEAELNQRKHAKLDWAY